MRFARGHAARLEHWNWHIVITVLLIGLSAPAGAAEHNGVVSLNLCTDSMLLELAPRDRITALSYLARDASLSPLAELAKDIPITRGYAEEVVRLKPATIISGANSTAATNALLVRLGYRLELFEPARDLGDFATNLRRLGRLLNEESRANALLARLERRLRTQTPLEPTVTVLMLEPNGYVPGPETLADDLLAALGVVNLAPELGVPDGGFVTLEQLARHPPDWLLVGEIDRTKPALASEFLRHPMLRRALSQHTQVLAVPESLWACGGSYFADAIELVGYALKAHPSP